MVSGFLYLIVLVVSVPAWAAEVELSLDAQSIEVGQVIGLSVTVSDGTPSGVPQIDADRDLRVAYQQQVSNSYWVNGKSSRTVKFRYAVAPGREGTFRIGPARVQVGGQLLTTSTQTLEVKPRPEAERVRLEAEAGFTVDRAWEGQVVLYRYGLRSRVPVAGSRWNIPPPEGWVRPRDGDQPRRQYSVAEPEGTLTVDETWIPFLATSPGIRELPGAVVQVDLPVEKQAKRRSAFSDLFGMYETRSEVLATTGSRVEVLALPKAPEGFSGLVGDFEVTAEADRTTTTVGGSVEWTVTIRGDGTLEGMRLPSLAEVEGVRVYPGTPATEAQVDDGRYRGEGRFPWVLVPTTEGELRLPPLRIVSFSPSRGTYVTTEVPVPMVRVMPGGEQESKVASFARPSREAPAPIVDGVRPPLARGRGRVALPAGVWIGLPFLVGLPALLLGARQGAGWVHQVWQRRRSRRVSPPSGIRLERWSDDPPIRFAQMDAALRSASAEGWPALRLEQRRRLLEACARARFGGEPPAADFESKVLEVLGWQGSETRT